MVPIIYQDENILIARKPAGLSVLEDGGKKSGSLTALLAAQTGALLTPCHRLDHNTQGLVAFAKNPAAQKALEEAFYHRRAHKKYMCIALGAPPDGLYTAFLFKNAGQALAKVQKNPAPGALPIKTGFTLLQKSGELALLEVALFTGRTHQIRAHLSFLNHPVLGDDKYGFWQANRRYGAKKQALSAVSLSFDFPTASRLAYLNGLEFKAPPQFPEKAASLFDARFFE